MIDIFQGDPALVMSVNGSRLVFKGGQPVMDQGIENMAQISLFTAPGWIGNTLIADPDKQIGSVFEEVAKRPITLSSLSDTAQAGENALANPLFGNITSDIQNPTSSQIKATFTIEMPGRDIEKLIVEKNGINWISQRDNPAHERI